MKRLLLVVLLIGTVAVPQAGGFPANAASEAKAEPDRKLSDSIRLFEAWIQSKIAYQALPGMSIAVVHDQTLVWAKGFGWSDVEKKTPADIHTVYRIGSITKLFTATAIMQLQERGLLQIDDPVVKYLPWFTARGPAAAPPITIRHLLTHSSGLPDELPLSYWTDGKFPTIQQIQEGLRSKELPFPPENKLIYSNLGFSVLGQVISAVSGQPYDKYIEDSILKPLGMNDTSVFINGDQRKRLATGYSRKMPDAMREIRPFENLQGLAPAGNISSTVEDLARFLSAQFRDTQPGVQILKRETWNRMYRPQALLPDWRGGFGLGFMIRNTGESVIVGHEGWVSGFRSRIRMDPRTKIGVIVLANADDADVLQICDQALQLFGPALQPARAAGQMQSPPDQWEKYVGKYRSVWGDLQILLMNGELVMIDPNEDSFASIKRLHPEDRNSFRVEGGHLGEDGELVVFEPGIDGKIKSMNLGATIIEKLP